MQLRCGHTPALCPLAGGGTAIGLWSIDTDQGLICHQRLTKSYECSLPGLQYKSTISFPHEANWFA